MQIFDFKNDFVFKYVFGEERNEKLLISLLNALLRLEGPDKITWISILNPFNQKEFVESKLSIVDVKAKDGLERQFNIEVQMESEPGYVPRVLFYWAKLFSQQLEEGKKYTALSKTTSISILNYVLFPKEPRMENIFQLRQIETHAELTDLLDVRFLDLKKFSPQKPKNLRSVFEKWLYALKFGELYAAEDSSLPNELSSEEGIAMAIQELRKINADRELRQILEARSKEAHTRATIIADAEERGMAKGREEERHELARKLLKRGMTIPEVCDITGLPENEIKRS
ncbi:Rpn family recombination-promoting nuclease/putative transposase [bacterium]|nr:Rpn family recombination-promoting nuclease/putative transposase [bacterium]